MAPSCDKDFEVRWGPAKQCFWWNEYILIGMLRSTRMRFPEPVTTNKGHQNSDRLLETIRNLRMFYRLLQSVSHVLFVSLQLEFTIFSAAAGSHRDRCSAGKVVSLSAGSYWNSVRNIFMNALNASM